jgi:hypothetical protein
MSTEEVFEHGMGNYVIFKIDDFGGRRKEGIQVYSNRELVTVINLVLNS